MTEQNAELSVREAIGEEADAYWAAVAARGCAMGMPSFRFHRGGDGCGRLTSRLRWREAEGVQLFNSHVAAPVDQTAVDMAGDAIVLGALSDGTLCVQHRGGEDLFRPGELFLADYGRRMRMQWTPHDFIGLVLPRPLVEAAVGTGTFGARSVHRIPDRGLARLLRVQLGLIWNAGPELSGAEWHAALSATAGLAGGVLRGCRRDESVTEPGLAPREKAVLSLLREGLTSKEIASRLGVSAGTVRAYRRSIYSKLGVTSRSAAIAIARMLASRSRPSPTRATQRP